jgi:hypothetical protein
MKQMMHIIETRISAKGDTANMKLKKIVSELTTSSSISRTASHSHSHCRLVVLIAPPRGITIFFGRNELNAHELRSAGLIWEDHYYLRILFHHGRECD